MIQENRIWKQSLSSNPVLESDENEDELLKVVNLVKLEVVRKHPSSNDLLKKSPRDRCNENAQSFKKQLGDQIQTRALVCIHLTQTTQDNCYIQENGFKLRLLKFKLLQLKHTVKELSYMEQNKFAKAFKIRYKLPQKV